MSIRLYVWKGKGQKLSFADPLFYEFKILSLLDAFVLIPFLVRIVSIALRTSIDVSS